MRTWIGYAHPDRLLSYPDVAYLSGCSLPIRMLLIYPDVRWWPGAPVLDAGGTAGRPQLLREHHAPSLLRGRDRGSLSVTVMHALPQSLTRTEPRLLVRRSRATRDTVPYSGVCRIEACCSVVHHLGGYFASSEVVSCALAGITRPAWSCLGREDGCKHGS